MSTDKPIGASSPGGPELGVAQSCLHHMVWTAALSLKEVTQTQPFGPEYEVFKVCGKVFAMTTNVRGQDIATVKSEPETGVALRQQHSFVTDGYHMNKRHWISLRAVPGIPQDLVDELVATSYLLVVDTLTKRQRAALDHQR